MSREKLLDEYRRWTVFGTILGKLTVIAFGVYVTYAVYQAGLESLALSIGLGGGLYAIVRGVTDWKAGRKPWLPIEHESVDTTEESSHVTNGMVIGTVLGKLTVLAFGASVTYVVYQAGMEGLAFSFAIGGGLYAIVHTITEWRDGKKPWQPRKRVQYTTE